MNTITHATDEELEKLQMEMEMEMEMQMEMEMEVEVEVEEEEGNDFADIEGASSSTSGSGHAIDSAVVQAVNIEEVLTSPDFRNPDLVDPSSSTVIFDSEPDGTVMWSLLVNQLPAPHNSCTKLASWADGSTIESMDW